LQKVVVLYGNECDLMNLDHWVFRFE